MGMVGVDDRGQGGGVGLVADVPLGGPDEPGVGHAFGRLGHAREAEIGAVGEDGA